jgi:hypothetical protein
MKYPRSPKLTLGGLAHLPRLLDKVRLRHAGEIQDYNYLTVGFDKYLLDLLQIKPDELEQRVREGGTDEELLAWLQAHGRPIPQEEARQWNERVLYGGPKDEAGRKRFQDRLTEVAAKRGVSVGSMPTVTAWSDIIELDEERM